MRLLLSPNLGDKFWFKYVTHRVDLECDSLEAASPTHGIQKLWLAKTFEPPPSADSDPFVDVEPIHVFDETSSMSVGSFNFQNKQI